MEKKTKKKSEKKSTHKTNQSFNKMASDVGKSFKKVTDGAGHVMNTTADGVAKGFDATQKFVIDAIDENGNGEIDIEDIIIKGLKTPGVRINRDDFLKKEFFKNFSEETVKDAIEYTPMHAGITREEFDKIADDVIQYERNFVSGISAALGAPGGVAMVATIPADII